MKHGPPRLAKRVAADYSTKAKPRWVPVPMGPVASCDTRAFPSPILEKLREQGGVTRCGADVLIVETSEPTSQTKARCSDLQPFHNSNRVRDRASDIEYWHMLNGMRLGHITGPGAVSFDVVGELRHRAAHMTESSRYLCETLHTVSVFTQCGVTIP